MKLQTKSSRSENVHFLTLFNEVVHDAKESMCKHARLV